MADIRKKLIELLAEYCPYKEKRCVGCDPGKHYHPECKAEQFGKVADHLIANGVTINEPPKHRKMLCVFWNPGHHGSKQRCEQLTYKPCSCNGDVDKCDYRRKEDEECG